MSVGKGIQLSTGFDVNTAQPLDSRELVDSIEERDNIINVYNGLRCYVNGVGEFRYVDGVWEEAGAGASSGGGANEIYIGRDEPSGDYSVWIDLATDPITSNNISDLIINEFRTTINALYEEVTSLTRRVSEQEARITYLEIYGGSGSGTEPIQGTQMETEDGSILIFEDGSFMLFED